MTIWPNGARQRPIRSKVRPTHVAEGRSRPDLDAEYDQDRIKALIANDGWA